LALALALSIPFVTALGVQAQVNDEINAGLQFSFAPPGAKSLAMGGAFVGLADDATAAFANPAGLLWLPQPEVSIEARRSTFTTQYPNGGSLTGTPTGCVGPVWRAPESPNNCQDVGGDGAIISPYDADTSGVAYLSYVHLFKKKRADAGTDAPPAEEREYNSRWRLALFRHELANFSARINSAEGAFLTVNQGRNNDIPTRIRLTPIQGGLDLAIDGYGVALARTLSEKKNLWGGLSLTYYDFSLEAETRRYLGFQCASNDRPSCSNQMGSTNAARPEPAAALFTPANEDDRHLQSGNDNDLAVTLGLLWKTKNDKFSVGAVYRQGPSFDFNYEFLTARRIPGHPGNATATPSAEDVGVVLGPYDPNIGPNNYESALSGSASFDVPDVTSLGFTYKPVTPLTFSFEFARVGYSSLEPKGNIQANNIAFACRNRTTREQAPNMGPDCPQTSESLANYKIDDADELRLGIEYEIDLGIGRPAINLRAGAWEDPDHQLRYDDPAGDVPPEQRTGNARRLVPRYPPGEDVTHLTLGVGVVSGQRFQIDLAADLSDRSDVYSLSTVFRWGGSKGEGVLP
jgi:long-subunit fatty acid transport protein